MLLLDIDGLRWDVFNQALEEGMIPHISTLLSSNPLKLPIVSTASSITFAAQASLITGRHPREHGVPGNQFFDRFGTDGQKPKFYAFDLGDTLEVSTAVGVFTEGLANDRLCVPTFFEQLPRNRQPAVVATHMYPRGATWLKPAVTHLARFLKGGNLLGLSPELFDQATIDHLSGYINETGLPPVLMGYLMGLDFESHKNGPDYQINSLRRIDRQLEPLVESALNHANGSLVTAVFSDHGQIATPGTAEKAIELGFPFGKELARFFTALKLDVHDYPGEAPHCDAVIALNGGTAAVYLHNQTGHWWDKPDFARDVLPVGRALWDASLTGRYEPRLKGNFDSVLVRNVERDGWNALYQALTPGGEVISLEEWFTNHTDQPAVDPVNRLDRYVNRYSGDCLLISRYQDGFHFGKPIRGTHGGLHPEDSIGMLAFGCHAPHSARLLSNIKTAIDHRCRAENNRHPSVVDLVTGLKTIIN